MVPQTLSFRVRALNGRIYKKCSPPIIVTYTATHKLHVRQFVKHIPIHTVVFTMTQYTEVRISHCALYHFLYSLSLCTSSTIRPTPLHWTATVTLLTILRTCFELNYRPTADFCCPARKTSTIKVENIS